jgi:hypothetical protein
MFSIIGIITLLSIILIYIKYKSTNLKFEHLAIKELTNKLGKPTITNIYNCALEPETIAVWTTDLFDYVICKSEEVTHDYPSTHNDFLYITMKIKVDKKIIDYIGTKFDTTVHRNTVTLRCCNISNIMSGFLVMFDLAAEKYPIKKADYILEEYIRVGMTDVGYEFLHNELCFYKL